MKKLAAMLCVSAMATGAFAQGTVTFANGPTTLISSTPHGGTSSTLAAAPVGSYYYALLYGTSATGPFTLTSPGIYATNTAAGSKLGSGLYQPGVPGWAANTTGFFEVAGWSANLGATFNSAWLNNNVPKGYQDPVWGNVSGAYFGLSSVGTGTSGGGQTPPLPVFGGTGAGGFSLAQVTPVTVPEPSSLALAGLGAAALLIFRRRK